MRKKNQKVMTVLLFCLLFNVNAHSNFISGGMQLVEKYTPNVMEYAIVANTVNVLYQIGQLARTTLQLVRSYQQSYAELVRLKDEIEKTWENITTLFDNFDPYNMDTWAFTLRRAQGIIRYNCGDILRAFNNAEFVVPTVNYVLAVDSMFFYDYRARKNREVIDKYYKSRNLDSLANQFARVVAQYNNATMQSTERRIIELRQSLANPYLEQGERDELQAELDLLEDDVDILSRRSFEMFAVSHEDSLIVFTTDLVTYNLTEMQIIQNAIEDLEEAADELVEQYYSLKSGLVSNHHRRDREQQRTYTKEMEWPSDDIPIYESENLPLRENSNRAQRPTEPLDRFSGSFGKKKKINYHDLTHLQNAIDFVTLKQEMVLRDIAVLKAKSMAMIAAGEAYDRQKTEIRVLIQVNDFEDVVSVMDSIYRWRN